MMMTPSSRSKDGTEKTLNIDEVRLVSDLRIMHTKVNELFSIVEYLRRRHDEADIVKYADYDVLADDIRKVDEIYLWFVRVKEERDAASLGD